MLFFLPDFSFFFVLKPVQGAEGDLMDRAQPEGGRQQSLPEARHSVFLDHRSRLVRAPEPRPGKEITNHIALCSCLKGPT